MRPIDADALPNELFKKHVHDGEELAPMLYYDDAVKVVEDAPTIPAIPVEWLVNLKNEYAREGREQAEGDLMNLLLMWQKEQEAQDTADIAEKLGLQPKE